VDSTEILFDSKSASPEDDFDEKYEKFDVFRVLNVLSSAKDFHEMPPGDSPRTERRLNPSSILATSSLPKAATS